MERAPLKRQVNGHLVLSQLEQKFSVVLLRLGQTNPPSEPIMK